MPEWKCLGFSDSRKGESPETGAFSVNVQEIVTECLSLRFGTGCRGSSNFLAVRALDAGGLALQIAQVIQSRPANFALANHLNRADRRRMQREDALDTHSKAHAAHCEGGAGSPALL